MEMEIKYMILQLEQTFSALLKESIVNIQDLSLNYDDTLCAYCPILKKYYQWIGVCMNCFENHPNQLKVVRVEGKGYSIQVSEMYEMIDIVSFTKVVRSQLDSELKKVFEDCEAQEKQFAQTIQRVIEYIIQIANSIIIEQYKNNSFAMFCSKNDLHKSQNSIKFIIECKKKQESWRGYCPFCKLNEKHQIIVKLMGNQNMMTKNYRNQTSHDLVIDGSNDYRLVDIYKFQIKIQKYLEIQVYEIFFNKAYQILSISSKNFQEIIKKYNQNTDSIIILQQQKDINLQSQQQYVIKQNLIKNELQKHEGQIQEIKQIVWTFDHGSLYDIQINCANLSDLNTAQGWTVIKNDAYEKQKNFNCSVVSFYGLYNKGKSFLASKLSGKIISTGYSISTIGLSALYPKDLSKENSIIFLDTAGLETPINQHKKDAIYQQISDQYQTKSDEIKQQKIYEAKLTDRLRTENLIQQFVLSQSHLILIIVDQLSKEEQKLLRRIRTKKYSNSQIVVVHNFSKLTHLEQLEKYIKIDIENSFERVEAQFRDLGNNISGYVYIESRDDDKGNELSSITHVIMANEYSEAGKKYNPFCYKYLQSRIVSINSFNSFDLIKSLMDEVEKQIVNLFKLTSEQKKQQYKLQYDETKNVITTNLQKADLKPISFDMLGDMQVYDEEETPKYNYSVTQQNLILNIELSGRFEPQKEDQEDKFKRFICLCNTSGCSMLEWHTFINGEQFIQLRAQYLGPDPEKLVKPENTSDSKIQRLNKFQLVIPISTMQCILKPNGPKLSFKLGIATLEYLIQKKEQQQ